MHYIRYESDKRLNVTGQKSPGEPRLYYGFIIVVLIFIVMLLSWGTLFSYGVFFNPMLAEFGWTRALVSGAYTLGSLTRGILSIITGRICDRFGLRILITTCGILLGVGFLLMSRINSVWELYIYYGVIVATGIAGCWAPLVATVPRWFVWRRGLMIGIVTSGVSFGMLIIPPVITRLISWYGWRDSYIIMGIVCMVLVIIMAQFLKRDPQQMGLLPYSERRTEQAPQTLKASGFSLGEASRTNQFWLICTTYFCYGFFAYCITVHIAPHATDIGLSAINAANVLAIIGGTGIVGRIAMGSVSDRIGIKPSLIIIFIMSSVTLLWLQVANGLWTLYLFALLFGFAYGGLSALQPLLIAGMFGLSSLGLLVGSFSVSFTTGSAIGVFAAGYMFDISGSYHLAFFSCAVLSIIGLVLTALIRPIRDNYTR